MKRAKPKKEPKRERIALFVELLSEEQRDQLKARAKAAECISVAEYVRQVLFPREKSAYAAALDRGSSL